MMESNNTNQEYFDDDVTLAEPHFDEEATVLSARPVVPLKELKANRSAKQLLFGLAIAGSLMLGVLAATLIYKRGGTGQSSATNKVASGAAGIAVEEPSSSAAAAEPIGGAVPETLPQAETATADKKTVPLASHSASHSTAPGAIDTKESTPSPELDETELTRDERIGARHLRRRAERQARRESAGRPRRSADDLLRIRDIFEGPSRP